MNEILRFAQNDGLRFAFAQPLAHPMLQLLNRHRIAAALVFDEASVHPSQDWQIGFCSRADE
jgi:hypothetical protein